ncbi:MAG: acyltransferase family protein [Shimia sp.]
MRAPTPPRTDNFDLLRMLAAVAVLFAHAWPIALGRGAQDPITRALGHDLGGLAVAVFFAISGYFITRSWTMRPDRRRFLVNRALRLFPALAAMLGVTVLVAGLVVTAAPPETFWAAAPAYVLRNLSLVSLLYPLPGVFSENPYGPAINGSLWTLMYEVACYLGVLAAGLAGLLAGPRRARATVLAAICATLALQVAAPHPVAAALGRLGLPFALGAAIWIWRVPLTGPRAWAGAGGLIALAVAARVVPAAWAADWPVDWAAAGALSYGALVSGHARAPVLAAYNRLGDYSYGTYIYAFPIQQLVVWMGVAGPWANVAVALPLTLACAVASWHLVEAPALRLKPAAIRPVAAGGAPHPS